MAAMVASVAAAGGTRVSVFFSMNALAYFVKDDATEAPAEGRFGELMEKTKGVPPFRQLFKLAAELGDARLLPCSMALDLLQIEGSALEPELGPPTGLTLFLSDAESGQLLSF
ncbi:MAG: DsrE/DsrF/DrsH-like family protein [Gammaproteobacteria bacterium]|nr:DsrE/DsrF/DrsH-like family protein [Gammaproteobacteria bacterium]